MKGQPAGGLNAEDGRRRAAHSKGMGTPDKTQQCRFMAVVICQIMWPRTESTTLCQIPHSRLWALDYHAIHGWARKSGWGSQTPWRLTRDGTNGYHPVAVESPIMHPWGKQNLTQVPTVVGGGGNRSTSLWTRWPRPPESMLCSLASRQLPFASVFEAAKSLKPM